MTTREEAKKAFCERFEESPRGWLCWSADGCYHRIGGEIRAFRSACVDFALTFSEQQTAELRAQLAEASRRLLEATRLVATIRLEPPDPELFGADDDPHNQVFLVADNLTDLLAIRSLPDEGWRIACEEAQKLVAMITAIRAKGTVS